MTDARQLEEIKAILDFAFVPTTRTRGNVEQTMTQAERVQWAVNELRISLALNKLTLPQKI